MSAVAIERLRPAAVEAHVTSVARRLGCSAVGTARARRAAIRALNNGETAHRAIQVAIHVAASDAETLRRIRKAEAEHAPSHFWRDLFVDMLGFVAVCVVVVLGVVIVWLRLGVL